MRILLLAASVTTILSAQGPLVLRFVHVQDAKSMAETGTVVRSVGEILDLRVDAQARTLTVSGPQWQTDLAAWVFSRLDRPMTDTSPAGERYEIDGQADPSVRVVYPRQTRTPQSLAELSTIVRSVTEIRRAFVSQSARAFVMRGTPEQITAADWLLTQLDGRPLPTETHSMAGMEEGVMRVFWLQPSISIEQLQEQTTAVRAQTRMRRIFTHSESRAVAVRGTADQVTTAERLFRERGLLAAPGLN